MTPEGLPPLNWLRAFEASARHLSFTRAATELNMTQSAVSQHVRSLEVFLGRDLFQRRTRAIDLTEAGSNYLPVVREAFNLLASGTRAFTGGDRGQTLTLQCNLAFSVFWLAPRLKRLYTAYPWLVLNIVTPSWDPQRTATHAEIEIRFGLPEDMSASAGRLTRERFFPVCRPDYQDGQLDLPSAVLLDCAGMTGSWGTWFKSQGQAFDGEGRVTIASTFVISVQMALHGAGITMIHSTLAADLLESKTMIRPFDHAPDLTEAYFLSAPADHQATPASRAFQTWIREEIASAA